MPENRVSELQPIKKRKYFHTTRRNGRKVIRDIKHRMLGIPWFEVEARDCFIASYPRSGNTWLRHILFFYLNDGATDVDMLQLDSFCPIIDGIDLKYHMGTKNGAAKRFIKTHEFGANYMTKGKIVYLVRDGRDAVWSYHKYYRGYDRGPKDFDTFLDQALAGKVAYRSWHQNVASWLELKESPNFMLLRFEDMVRDPVRTFKEILTHLEIEIDEERVFLAVEKSNLERISQTFQSDLRAKKTSGSGAGQGGTVERWRTAYTQEQLLRFEEKARSVLHQLGYTPSTKANQ